MHAFQKSVRELTWHHFAVLNIVINLPVISLCIQRLVFITSLTGTCYAKQSAVKTFD